MRIPAMQGDAGQALVEFAMFLSVFVLIFSGVADFSIYIHQAMEITAAAEAGALYGAMPGNAKDLAGMSSAALTTAPDVIGLTVTPVDVYACTPGGAPVVSTATCSDGTPRMFVQVTASAPVPAALHWTGISNGLTLSGFASLEVPWQP